MSYSEVMSRERDVRAFDYVNQPYERVREALRGNAKEIFRNATRAAASRAHAVATGLHVNIGGIEIGAEIDLQVSVVEPETDPSTASGKATRLRLQWEAAKAPRLFPLMKGELSAYPLTATETQLDFSGKYQPPLGPLGSAIDALAGHKIAEASVHRFVTDIATYLRETLAKSGR